MPSEMGLLDSVVDMHYQSIQISQTFWIWTIYFINYFFTEGKLDKTTQEQLYLIL